MDRLPGLKPEVFPGRISLQFWDVERKLQCRCLSSLSAVNVTLNDLRDTPLEWLMPMLFPLILAHIKISSSVDPYSEANDHCMTLPEGCKNKADQG